MTEENIICSVKTKYLKKLQNYLEKNSAEYDFSTKKDEEKCICFIDNQKRIFAILNKGKKEIELTEDINPEIMDGVEKIIFSGGRP
jgi:hypothetical protein